jgi:hypothetical protein
VRVKTKISLLAVLPVRREIEEVALFSSNQKRAVGREQGFMPLFVP